MASFFNKKNFEKKRGRLIIFGLLIFLLFSLIANIIYYSKFSFPVVDNNNLNVYIAKIADIPLDERPAIAEILEKSNELKKKNPVLFKDAKEGDLLMVYKTKALVFRPTDNKIISLIFLENSLEEIK